MSVIINPGGGSGGPVNLAGGAGSVTGVLPAANGGTVNVATAGQGYFIGGMVTCDFGGTYAAAVIAGATNQVRCVQFVLPFAASVTKVSWEVGANAGDNVGFGIYSADGATRLLTTGAVVSAGTGASQQATISVITFVPGVYWFAWTQDGTPSTTIGSTSGSAAFYNLVLNAGSGKRMGTSNQAGAAGVLPATLGTISGAQIGVPLVMFEP